MSSHCNPSVVDDGLVFLYDVEDIQSYKGEPTVNLAGSIVKRFSNWSGLTGTTEYYTTSSGDQGVKLVTTASGGVQWYSFSTIYNIQASTQYTISATVKYTGGTPHPNLLYVRQYDGNGQTSESGKFTTANVRDLGGGWKRIWRTFTTDSTTTHINLQGYEYNTGKTIYIQDLQFELKSHATQFAGVSTTRSATQGLIDRTGDRTIDLSNVSFDSNAEMIFDGTDDYISIPTYTFGNGSWTLNMWVNVSAFANYNLMSNSSGGPVANVFGAHGSNPKIFYMNYDGAWKDHYGNLTLTTNNWYFLTWVNYEGASASAGTMKMYVNGVADSDVFNSYTTNGGPCNVIGKRWGGTSFNGKISQVSINTKSLSDPEILRNFNATKSRFGL
jgi:hypothetical protein